MKYTYRLLLSLLLLGFLVSLSTFGCGSSIPIGLSVGNQYYSLAGAPDSDFYAKFWQTNNTANWSGTQTTCGVGCTTFPNGGILYYADLGAGLQHYIYADWGNAGSLGGCPTSVDQTTVLIEQRVSEGASGHQGQFQVVTADYNGVQYDTDVAPAGQVPLVNIPTPTIFASVVGPTYWDLTLTGFAPASLNGFYTTNPGNVVTGVKFYYIQSVTAPTTSTPASWTPVAQVNSVAGNQLTWGSSAPPANVVVSVPKVAPGGPTTYIAETLLFGNNASPAAFESKFTGGNSSTIGPTPAGLFVSVTASAQNKLVTVNWTTNVESGVVAYDVVYSKKKNGPFQMISGTTTAPTGNGSSYSKTFARPRGSDKLFIKVKATMTSGVDEYSNLVAVGGSAATK